MINEGWHVSTTKNFEQITFFCEFLTGSHPAPAMTWTKFHPRSGRLCKSFSNTGALYQHFLLTGVQCSGGITQSMNMSPGMSKLGLMIDCVQSIKDDYSLATYLICDLILDLNKLESNAKCKIVDGFKMSFLHSATAGTIPQHNNRGLILKTILSP